LCGKKKKVEHASRARFDRLGGVTGSGVKHVNAGHGGVRQTGA
jgi:hypothetical protein